MQSGSIHVPPTGTNWPDCTYSTMRAHSSGSRSSIQA
jgi:hypothetical protein